MTTLEVSRLIKAPPEAVFAVFADLHHAAERIQGISALEVLTPGPVGQGTRWRETRTMFGKDATEEMTINEFDPPRGYKVEAASHGCSYHSEFRFTSEGDATRATMLFRGEAHSLLAKIMMFLMGSMMRKSTCKMMDADMADLQRFLEEGGRAD